VELFSFHKRAECLPEVLLFAEMLVFKLQAEIWWLAVFDLPVKVNDSLELAWQRHWHFRVFELRNNLSCVRIFDREVYVSTIDSCCPLDDFLGHALLDTETSVWVL